MPAFSSSKGYRNPCTPRAFGNTTAVRYGTGGGVAATAVIAGWRATRDDAATASTPARPPQARCSRPLSGARRGWFFGSLGLTVASLAGGYAIGGPGGILVASIGGGLGLGGMMAPLFLHDTFTATRSP